jgi:hypothetical protein
LGKFAPTVLIDGKVVTPKGWVWVLAFALAGCEWAIKEASTEEFKEIMRRDLRETNNKQVSDRIAYYELEIERLRKEFL